MQDGSWLSKNVKISFREGIKIFSQIGHPEWLSSAITKIAKNVKQKYFMNYQMDFYQICVRLMLSLCSKCKVFNLKAQCRCDIAFLRILVVKLKYWGKNCSFLGPVKSMKNSTEVS